MHVTDDDRFVMTALSLAVEDEVGKTRSSTDNLFRQASLWGAHPLGEVILQPIAAEVTAGRRCAARARVTAARRAALHHSGGATERNAPCGNHAEHRQGLYPCFGKADPINPCMSRCGAGCNGVGTSAWTQDCGNHDICEYWHTSDCGGELSSASDDFSFAPNCGC